MKKIFKNQIKDLFLLGGGCLKIGGHAVVTNMCSMIEIKNWIKRGPIFSVSDSHDPPIGRSSLQKVWAFILDLARVKISGVADAGDMVKVQTVENAAKEALYWRCA